MVEIDFYRNFTFFILNPDIVYMNLSFGGYVKHP